MWFMNPTGVSISAMPCPSKFRDIAMLVSPVSRRISAVRCCGCCVIFNVLVCVGVGLIDYELDSTFKRRRFPNEDLCKTQENSDYVP